MAATLIVVAATASRMINLEKDCCRLKAMRLAINEDIFNGFIFNQSLSKNRLPMGSIKVFSNFIKFVAKPNNPQSFGYKA
jgi:hypothetical protein